MKQAPTTVAEALELTARLIVAEARDLAGCCNVPSVHNAASQIVEDYAEQLVQLVNAHAQEQRK